MPAPMEILNSRAQQARAHIIGKYPSWSDYFGIRGEDDLEVAVPTPAGSNAGHLGIFTNGDDLWLHYSPPLLSTICVLRARRLRRIVSDDRSTPQ
jgi:hypothetical protein